jgi:ligand-binding sensor domain-containing protein
MNYKNLLALILILVLYVSCKEKQKAVTLTPEIIQPAAKNLVSAYGPTRMVRSVKQAKNGDILIASYTGLWRYDGKTFTNLTTAINSPSIWDVLEDQKGNLWIATKDSGIYVYNGKSFQHYTTRQGLASNMALQLYEDRAGNIWSNAGGLSRFDGKTFKTYTTKDGLSDNSVNTFLEDKNGRMWIGTRGDACYFDGKTFTIFKNKEGKPFHNVWSIVEDQNGTIWFGAEIIKEFKNSTYYMDGAPGLWRYDGTNYTKMSERAASAIMLDKQGNIWTTGAEKSIGNSTWKLLKYDQNSLSSENPTITDIATIDKMLCRIIEATDGSIWFGSLNGVYHWDGKTLTDFKAKQEQVYQIDQKESRITWKGSMKISAAEKHVGYVAISKGELWVENNRLVGGAATIDMNAMEFADKNDKNTPIMHLQSADYFDVKRFPFATIEIAQVDSLTDKSVQITGYLTIKTVSHLVSFPATIDVQNGVLNANAKLTIDRTKWGISFMSGKFYKKMADEIVSDEIDFEIKIVGKK